MRQQTHKRGRFTNKTVAIVAALALGGGGAAIIAANASAHGDRSGSDQNRTVAAKAGTIQCPDVGQKLNDVPSRARPQVDKNLAELDNQVAKAYQRMNRQQGSNDAVLSKLHDERSRTLGNIGSAMGGDDSQLQGMVDCKWQDAGTAGGDGQQQGGQQQGDGQQDGQQQGGEQQGGEQQGGGQEGGNQQGANEVPGNAGGQAGNGPAQDDFVDITTVQPNVQQPPQAQENGSTGTFTTECGVGDPELRNSDNVIVAPGVGNGAHHTHDYVGNDSNDAFANNQTFEQGGTSCENQDDKSTYYWPVVRAQDGKDEADANDLGGGQEGNVGTILTPKSSKIEFKGNAQNKVTAMPKFLRIITGDAKAFTNGDANANASWSCTGFEDRQLTDKYPLCPAGSSVTRTFDFQSCWDGQNIDSANHRDHVAFAGEDGSCPNGFKAIPQLVNTITYDVPANTPFAVDGFPEQLHKPITDHDDFINVMSEDLMNEAVDCINSGKQCG
ncbi:DUF1996 domain-containing protein [Streptomyces samsunensis]|uniref:DUF1996 domain-containing protein n=1 Tax=Streptomyces malaysiensis TaxID=92644 RepID=UPI00158420FA|nr:DUF1996 domain-containing protein [Streptomyces samsunensis]MCC4314669.1 DUF1996 domain-containing protein [Streptomyces malaysiensis]NUH37301.1 DUF1996 domain-containing protein [Streptomyces samsunensis]